MKGVFWVDAFHKLSLVVTIHEELNVSDEGVHSSGETSGLAR